MAVLPQHELTPWGDDGVVQFETFEGNDADVGEHAYAIVDLYSKEIDFSYNAELDEAEYSIGIFLLRRVYERLVREEWLSVGGAEFNPSDGMVEFVAGCGHRTWVRLSTIAALLRWAEAWVAPSLVVVV